MAAKVTETASPSMVQFVMEQHWNFSEVAFCLAKTISAIKRFRKEAIMKLYDVPELPIIHNCTKFTLQIRSESMRKLCKYDIL